MRAAGAAWTILGSLGILVVLACCSTVETAPSGTTVSSTASASGTGGTGGSSSKCGEMIECAPDERCGFERCPSCNEVPVCRKPGPCAQPRGGYRCDDNTWIEADCETGLFEAPVTGALTDCEL